MKTLISTLALILFIGTVNVSAQISRPKPQITKPGDRPISTTNPNMNLKKIQSGLLNRKGFVMTGTATIIEKPVSRGAMPFSYNLAFSNKAMETRSGSDYVQCNADLYQDNRASSHKFRVYVHSQRNSVGGYIDTKKIKVNWKGSRFGELNFKLENVKITYSKYGIIVTGTYKRGGVDLGMSFTMHEVEVLL